MTNCCGLTDLALAGVAIYCPHLTELIGPSCSGLTDASIEAIIGMCAKLALFEADFWNITDAAMAAIAANCRISTSAPRAELNVAGNPLEIPPLASIRRYFDELDAHPQEFRIRVFLRQT